MTHDYKRNGTTTLFAALNVLDGTVIGHCSARHRHQEFVRFLTMIDERTPPDLDLHLVVDNYATHKHPDVKRWLTQHPRFRLHFTPTSASWLNLVERFFAEITRKRIRRGVFRSVTDPQVAIYSYLAEHNDHPKPFVCVARQYWGQLGKQDNCQVAVSLSAANDHASLPIAYRRYLPHEWADNPDRRAQAGVPDDVVFQTKPQIALDQLRAALAAGIEAEVALADAGYGTGTDFRDGITQSCLPDLLGIQSSTS